MRCSTVLITAAVALALTACGSDTEATPQPDSSSAAPSPDDVYVAYLEEQDIIPTYGDADTAITLGRQICDRYDRGDGFAAVVDTLVDNGIPAREAGQINGAATAAFCPEHVTT